MASSVLQKHRMEISKIPRFVSSFSRTGTTVKPNAGTIFRGTRNKQQYPFKGTEFQSLLYLCDRVAFGMRINNVVGSIESSDVSRLAFVRVARGKLILTLFPSRQSIADRFAVCVARC